MLHPLISLPPSRPRSLAPSLAPSFDLFLVNPPPFTTPIPLASFTDSSGLTLSLRDLPRILAVAAEAEAAARRGGAGCVKWLLATDVPAVIEAARRDSEYGDRIVTFHGRIGGVRLGRLG